MGRTLDALLGRTSSRKTSKLKGLLSLSVSRLAILRNQRKVRCSQARGDVAQLLQLRQQDRALLRVEQVIKEQDMLDVFVMIEGYCHLLTERAPLLELHKECPDELREAIASLIFAASRCGDLPELQEIRWIFALKFGKEFVATAVELRNSCGVNSKMIQKLSTRQPSLEIRMKVMKEIAAERGITLNLEEVSAEIAEVKVEQNLNQNKSQSQPTPNPSADYPRDLSELDRDEHISDSMKRRQKYKDVASAAQAAFESAAYAAVAARAAVELSRSESQGKGSDDQSRSGSQRGNGSEEWKRNEDEQLAGGSNFEKIHPAENYSSESDQELVVEQRDTLHSKGFGDNSAAHLEKSASVSSSYSTRFPLQEKKMDSNESGSTKLTGKEILFDESDSETEKQWGFEGKLAPSSRSRRSRGISGHSLQLHRQFNAVSDANLTEKREVINLRPPYQKQKPVRPLDDLHNSSHEETDKVGLGFGNEDNPVKYYAEGRTQTKSAYLDSAEKLRTPRLNIEKRPVSMRTRR